MFHQTQLWSKLNSTQRKKVQTSGRRHGPERDLEKYEKNYNSSSTYCGRCHLSPFHFAQGHFSALVLQKRAFLQQFCIRAYPGHHTIIPNGFLSRFDGVIRLRRGDSCCRRRHPFFERYPGERCAQCAVHGLPRRCGLVTQHGRHTRPC